MNQRRFFALLATMAMAPLLAAGTAPAVENVDPDNDGSQYAYSENVGWLNAEPLGQGGPGVEVSDAALSGYMWGENIGWVSLSCENVASCRNAAYGVTNDGAGVLGGFAWSENVGWISFSCENTSSCATQDYGVTIDPQTGDFSGRAWGENIGWITFASDGPNPFKVKTSWTSACSAPLDSPVLGVSKAGLDAQLDWSVLPGAANYDVVRGDLGVLRGTAGDFAAATQSCAVDDGAGTSATLGGNPPPGGGFWFLVRGVACAAGTYDSGGPFQVTGRDAGVLASGNDCP